MRDRLGSVLVPGVTMQPEHPPSASEADRKQDTSDFDVLSLDLSLKGKPRRVPDPLYSASPERLESVRNAVRKIVAARRSCG